MLVLQLTEEISDWRRDFDPQLLTLGKFAVASVDISEHWCSQRDGEQIIGVGEEPNSCDKTRPSMVPPAKALSDIKAADCLRDPRQLCVVDVLKDGVTLFVEYYEAIRRWNHHWP